MSSFRWTSLLVLANRCLRGGCGCRSVEDFLSSLSPAPRVGDLHFVSNRHVQRPASLRLITTYPLVRQDDSFIVMARCLDGVCFLLLSGTRGRCWHETRTSSRPHLSPPSAVLAAPTSSLGYRTLRATFEDMPRFPGVSCNRSLENMLSWV